MGSFQTSTPWTQVSPVVPPPWRKHAQQRPREPERQPLPATHPSFLPRPWKHEQRDLTARGLLVGYKTGSPDCYLPTLVQCQAEHPKTKPETHPECGHCNISKKGARSQILSVPEWWFPMQGKQRDVFQISWKWAVSSRYAIAVQTREMPSSTLIFIKINLWFQHQI